MLLDRVRTLLEFKADPNPRQPAEPDWELVPPPLAASTSWPVLKLLLEAGANPDNQFVAAFGDDAPDFCFLVAQAEHPENLRLLLEHGANPHGQAVAADGDDVGDYGGPPPPLTPPLLRMWNQGASAASILVLLEYGAELTRHTQRGRLTHSQTPLSHMMLNPGHRNLHLLLLLLRLPFSLPATPSAICFTCMANRGCRAGVCRENFQASAALLEVLIRIGNADLVHPSQRPPPGAENGDDGQDDADWELLESLRQALVPGRDLGAPADLWRRLSELGKRSGLCAQEGRRRWRQEFLGGFWTQIVRRSGLGGTVASLVFQAVHPDFQLRLG